MDIGNIDRCRPYGAWVWGGSFFYTDAAPLGLRRGGHRNATQMPPHWGLGLGWIIFLHRCRPAGATEGWAPRCYTDAAPLGLRFGMAPLLNGSGHACYTDAAPLGLNGGVGTVMLHRCRPAGAKEGWASHNYTDAAPLGLGFGMDYFSTQMPPRWG